MSREATVADEQRIYGLMASFETPEELVRAAEQIHERGYRSVEAFSPFPVEGIDEALGRKPDKTIASLVLAGALIGATTAYAMQYISAVWDYPINVGGRPMHSWVSFIPITFELGVLFGAFAGVIGMLLLNRLPRLHHPVFEVRGFERASSDRFFIMIEADDEQFDRDETHSFLRHLSPLEVQEVPCT